ncbi:hypothetical protein B0H67DRAFT_119602 [Lasiosphaeris hirsuta]|uniref:Uncharacterized protein n=1 Tax=Lasiosphaeris hirsuta TaxID=260670 RepID=A0AA40AZT3_9PEZI|nr:hypothetical protein B0H67DRAFT_119602 [Lasiosphaeris hirsuta]
MPVDIFTAAGQTLLWDSPGNDYKTKKILGANLRFIFRGKCNRIPGLWWGCFILFQGSFAVSSARIKVSLRICRIILTYSCPTSPSAPLQF